MLTAFADVNTDVAGCEMGWFTPNLLNERRIDDGVSTFLYDLQIT